MSEPHKITCKKMQRRQETFFLLTWQVAGSERLTRTYPEEGRAVLVDATPKKVRCYDNGGETFDRYTVVFTGNYRKKTGGEFLYLGMSEHPSHPQGFGQHGSSPTQIDRPRSSHLGKRIPFSKLPEDCQKCVLQDYVDLWDVDDPMGRVTRRED